MGSNLDTMPENSNPNKGIESGRDIEELETKGKDRIRAGCWRSQNKTKGSNPDTISENPKQKEGIESWRNARKLK